MTTKTFPAGQETGVLRAAVRMAAKRAANKLIVADEVYTRQQSRAWLRRVTKDEKRAVVKAALVARGIATKAAQAARAAAKVARPAA